MEPATAFIRISKGSFQNPSFCLIVRKAEKRAAEFTSGGSSKDIKVSFFNYLSTKKLFVFQHAVGCRAPTGEFFLGLGLLPSVLGSRNSFFDDLLDLVSAVFLELLYLCGDGLGIVADNRRLVLCECRVECRLLFLDKRCNRNFALVNLAGYNCNDRSFVDDLCGIRKPPATPPMAAPTRTPIGPPSKPTRPRAIPPARSPPRRPSTPSARLPPSTTFPLSCSTPSAAPAFPRSRAFST